MWINYCCKNFIIQTSQGPKAEDYSEPCQTLQKMERFVKIVNSPKRLTYFTKSSGRIHDTPPYKHFAIFQAHPMFIGKAENSYL